MDAKPERPREVAYFERLFVGSLALGLVQLGLNYEHYARLASLSFVVITTSLTMAVSLGMVLLVSRKRSRIALATMVLLFVLGLPIWLQTLTIDHFKASMFVSAIQMMFQVAAFAMFITPAARRWLFTRRVNVLPATDLDLPPS